MQGLHKSTEIHAQKAKQNDPACKCRNFGDIGELELDASPRYRVPFGSSVLMLLWLYLKKIQRSTGCLLNARKNDPRAHFFLSFRVPNTVKMNGQTDITRI